MTLPFQAVFLSWFLPTVVFTVVSGTASSSLLTYYPILIYVILAVVTIGCMLTLHIVSLVLRRYFSGRSKVFPFWYAFLGVSLTSSLVASVWFAHLNYMKNEIASDTLKRLAIASNVDPAVDSSSRYLDVGRVEFSNSTTLDLAKSIGFKNKEVYCVAPIVNNASEAPATYDYWAVGLNCCDENGFRCGEYKKPNARSGVRLLNEEQREFYSAILDRRDALRYGTGQKPPWFVDLCGRWRAL